MCISYPVLREHRHVALKIGLHEELSEELKFMKHLKGLHTPHGGSTLVRTMLDEFEVAGEQGKFQCTVHPPLAVTLGTFRRNLDDRALPADFLKSVFQHVLIALDFLHTDAKLIHTGGRRDRTYMTISLVNMH